VGYGDAAADSGGTKVLSPLKHLEKDAFCLLVHVQQSDQLAQDRVLRIAFEGQPHRISIEKGV